MRVAKGPYCSATGCHINRGANPDMSFFRFPKDPDRCKRWAINTGRKDFDNKTTEYLHNNISLCRNHFCDNQFMNAALKNKLVHDAIPTKFLTVPNEPPSAVKRKLPMQQSPTPVKQKLAPVWPFIAEITEYDNEERQSTVSQESKKEDNVQRLMPQMIQPPPVFLLFNKNKTIAGYKTNGNGKPHLFSQDSTIVEDIRCSTPQRKTPEPVIPLFTEITAYGANEKEARPSQVNHDSQLCDFRKKLKNLSENNRRLPEPIRPVITEITEYDNEERPSTVDQDSKKDDVRSQTPRTKEPEPVCPLFTESTAITEYEAHKHEAEQSLVSHDSTIIDHIQSSKPKEKTPEPVIPPFTEITVITEYVANKNEARPSQVIHNSKQNDFRRKLKYLRECNRKLRMSRDKYKQFSKKEMSRKELLLHCKHHLPERALVLLSAQMNISDQSNNGRQWNSDLMLLALSLFYYSPKAYTLLVGVLMLPSKSALKRWIQNMQFHPGINDTILLALGKKAEQMSPLDRCCCICIDNMALKCNLKIDENNDLITGYSYNGSTENVVIANSVICILVKGITFNWKQPIGYTFSCEGESSSSILHILKAFISNLMSIGFHVMCIVSNMGETFCQLRKELQVTVEKPYFLHDNRRIFYIHDPPDLLKTTRDALRLCNIEFGEKRACWDDVVSVYKEDSSRAFKMCPRVTKNHIVISPFKETNVKLAAQVLSFSMAAAIENLQHFGKLSPDALGTAVFCHFFDQLFDCLNSSLKEDISGKPFRSALKSSSVYWNFLESAPVMLKSFMFTDAHNVDCTNSMKFIEGWLLTIASMKGLYEDLKKMRNFMCLQTRNVNLDGVEHFFGKIYQTSKNAENLTPYQFENAFRIACVKALMKTPPETNYSYNADTFMKKMSSVLESMQTNEITEEPMLMDNQSIISSEEEEIVQNIQE